MGTVNIETLLASLGVDASNLTADQVLELGHEVAKLSSQSALEVNHPEILQPSGCILLRPTARAAKLIGIAPLPAAEPQPHEWYLNAVWIDGRKNVLLMHAATTFTVFVPDIRVADLRPIGTWLRTTISGALASEGLATDTLGDFASSDVVVVKPADRRVLGYMNRSSLYAQYAIEDAGGLATTDIDSLNRDLRRDPHSHGRTYATAIELTTGHRHWPPHATRGQASLP